MWDSMLDTFSKHADKWDIILGGTSTIFSKSFMIDTNLTTSFAKVYRIMNGFTTHWTLYNSSVYDKIIEWKNKQDSPIDVYMYKHAKVFVTLPFLAEQEEGFSNIENRQTDYHTMFENAEKKLKTGGFSIFDILPQK
jgi:molybdopterin-guanine dinucleotide biosynthesis protein A